MITSDEGETETDDEKRMNSAIKSMTVADVRKALSTMRREWGKHNCVQPFFPSQKITEHLTVSEFAFKFVMGHHAKRHAKFVSQSENVSIDKYSKAI